MTFHEWKKKTFTWVDNDVARYMQRAWAASTKEQSKQKAKLKAENERLKKELEKYEGVQHP